MVRRIARLLGRYAGPIFLFVVYGSIGFVLVACWSLAHR